MTAVVVPAARMVRSLPAAAHVRALRCVGRSNQSITADARLTTAQLRRAYRGDLIGWDVERRILALPVPDPAALNEEMSSLGARRRLQALHAIGWPYETLAAALGWGLFRIENILDRHPVRVRDFLLVCSLYDQRWTWVPEDHGVDPDDAEQSRLAAQLAECASPLAWDDDAIDSPAGRPRIGHLSRDHEFGIDPAAAHRALDGEPVNLSPKTRTLAIEYATRHLDMPLDIIAERLSMKVPSVQRSFERIKDRAREAGGRTWADEPRFTDLAKWWKWSA